MEVRVELSLGHVFGELPEYNPVAHHRSTATYFYKRIVIPMVTIKKSLLWVLSSKGNTDV